MQSYIGLTNIGYTITDEIHVGKDTYVLGHDPKNKCSPYVTWCSREPGNYFWGHYCANKNEARFDLIERAYKEALYIHNEANVSRGEMLMKEAGMIP